MASEQTPPDAVLPDPDPAPGFEYGQLDKNEIATQINAHIKEKEQKHLAARIQAAHCLAAAKQIDPKKDAVKRNNWLKEHKKATDMADALEAGIDSTKTVFAKEIAEGDEDSSLDL